MGTVKWMNSQRAAQHTYVTQQRTLADLHPSSTPSQSTPYIPTFVARLDCLLSTGSDKSVLALLCIIYFWPRFLYLLLLFFFLWPRFSSIHRACQHEMDMYQLILRRGRLGLGLGWALGSWVWGLWLILILIRIRIKIQCAYKTRSLGQFV